MSEVVQYIKNSVVPYWPLAAVPIGLIGVSKLLTWLIPGAHNNPKFDLRDKTVLITGASSGLGKALAFEFYKRVGYLTFENNFHISTFFREPR